MGNTNSKADNKVDSKLASTVDPVVGVQNGQPVNTGWNRTFARLRTAALYVLIGSIAITVIISLVTPFKFFPNEPKLKSLQTNKLLDEIRQYRSPIRNSPFRHSAKPQFI